ncbi:MAG: leucine-rich repeat domain-containing protein, partial [Clostridia bacterium]|nr:leucine-rich repeat domain-containing protein [Clostridia bacterium]
LESVILSENLKILNAKTFENCGSLLRVELPQGLEVIGYRVFYNCGSLKSIILPEGLTFLGQNAFKHCASLESITLPQGIDTIHDETFSECTALKTVVFGGKIIKIYSRAFSECTSLNNVCIPETVQYVGKDVFLNTPYYKDGKNWDNDALYLDGWMIGVTDNNRRSIEVKAGTKAMAAELFYNNKTIEKIVIPASLKLICSYSFYKCEQLDEAVFEDPNGWKAVQYSETILITELSDPADAAMQLSELTGYEWVKE